MSALWILGENTMEVVCVTPVRPLMVHRELCVKPRTNGQRHLLSSFRSSMKLLCIPSMIEPPNQASTGLDEDLTGEATRGNLANNDVGMLDPFSFALKR